MVLAFSTTNELKPRFYAQKPVSKISLKSSETFGRYTNFHSLTDIQICFRYL